MSVKVALRNLQDIFDEGFITQAEFNSRRKVIIDGATAIEPISSSSGTVKHAPTEGSVFSRLGGESGDAKRPSGGGADTRTGKTAPSQAAGGDLRSVLGKRPGISKPGRTDLRGVLGKVVDGGIEMAST